MIKHASLIGLISLFLILIPSHAVIDSLALRPQYTGHQLLLEGWRLLSAHLIHASWEHTFLLITNLVLLRIIFYRWLSNLALWSFITFSALFISIGLWLIGELRFYVGFSGIFHGLLALLLLIHWRSAPTIHSLALLCLIAKVLYEQYAGGSGFISDLIGLPIAVDAHALGLSSGIIFYVISKLCPFFIPHQQHTKPKKMPQNRA